jgi:hypothetical protein
MIGEMSRVEVALSGGEIPSYFFSKRNVDIT